MRKVKQYLARAASVSFAVVLFAAAVPAALVSAVDAYTLSGIVTDSSGQPVPSLQLDFKDVAAEEPVAIYAVTDNAGHYNLTAAPGVYYLDHISGNTSNPISNVLIYRSAGVSDEKTLKYDLTTTDLTQDFVLPTAVLNVAVTDGSGNPLSDVPVRVTSGFNNSLVALTPDSTAGYFDGVFRNGTTDTAGVAGVNVFATSYPAGNICADVSGNVVCNSAPVTVNGTTNLTLQLAPGTIHTLTGTLADSNGQPAPGLTLQFRDTETNNLATATVNSSGQYKLYAYAGTYYLDHINGNTSNPIGSVSIYRYFGVSSNKTLKYDLATTDLTQDFVLPTATLNVTVKDGNGNLVDGAAVTVKSGYGSSLFALTTDSMAGYYDVPARSGTTDGTGVASITAFATSYPAGNICADIDGSQVCNSKTVNVSGTTDLTLQQGRPRR